MSEPYPTEEEIEAAAAAEIINEREVQILRLRKQGLRLEDVSKQMHYTRERIRQMEIKAIMKMHRPERGSDE